MMALCCAGGLDAADGKNGQHDVIDACRAKDVGGSAQAGTSGPDVV